MLIAALISGGIAGIAGVSEVAGIQYHLIGELSAGLRLHRHYRGHPGLVECLGVVLRPSSSAWSTSVRRIVSGALRVPIFLSNIIQATMLMVALGMLLLKRYRIRRALMDSNQFTGQPNCGNLPGCHPDPAGRHR